MSDKGGQTTTHVEDGKKSALIINRDNEKVYPVVSSNGTASSVPSSR